MLLSSQPVDCCYYKIRTLLLLSPLACIRHTDTARWCCCCRQQWVAAILIIKFSCRCYRLPTLIWCCCRRSQLIVAIIIIKFCCHCHCLHALTDMDTARWCCRCHRRLVVVVVVLIIEFSGTVTACMPTGRRWGWCCCHPSGWLLPSDTRVLLLPSLACMCCADADAARWCCCCWRRHRSIVAFEFRFIVGTFPGAIARTILNSYWQPVARAVANAIANSSSNPSQQRSSPNIMPYAGTIAIAILAWTFSKPVARAIARMFTEEDTKASEWMFPENVTKAVEWCYQRLQ